MTTRATAREARMPEVTHTAHVTHESSTPSMHVEIKYRVTNAGRKAG